MPFFLTWSSAAAPHSSQNKDKILQHDLFLCTASHPSGSVAARACTSFSDTQVTLASLGVSTGQAVLTAITELSNAAPPPLSGQLLLIFQISAWTSLPWAPQPWHISQLCALSLASSIFPLRALAVLRFACDYLVHISPGQLPKGMDPSWELTIVFWFCSVFYLQHLTKCPAHSRSSINTFE